MIGLAVQMRIRGLVEAMIAAKEHRVASNHLRPPPMYPTRFEGDLPGPMWDTVVYDDAEKVLSTFDRVEREEERQARKDRLARDQAEQEEKERQERLAREREENGETVAGEASAAGADGDTSMVDGSTPAGSIPGTPMSGSFGALGDLKGKGRASELAGTGQKDKKRKRETPTQQAKNMSEDVRKRLSDQTAARGLGTKKFSWLSGGGGMDSPSMNKKPLPRPKFPPLPPSTLSISTSLPSPSGGSLPGTPGRLPGPSDPSTPLGATQAALGRLAGVPGLHEANKSKAGADDPADKLVTIRDALFVMEHERGRGAGTGSGTRPMMRAYMARQ